MRATKQILTTLLVIATTATTAFAANGDEGLGVLPILLLALFGLVIIGQLVPGLFLLWGMFRGATAEEDNEEKTELLPRQNGEQA